MSAKKLVVSGASNTNGPWPTWADFIAERYECQMHNVSKKGMGNEAIITSAIHASTKNLKPSDDATIAIMLTSIDKWDWYVADKNVVKRLDKEKHNITRLNANDPNGFWCTGGHFPLDKEYFRQNYYSHDYFAFKNLQLILMFYHVCNKNNWKYLVLYDSPIWSMLESELDANLPIDDSSFKLVNNNLCKWLFDSTNVCEDVYHPGLIGFLAKNNKPYFSEKYKCHPGPMSHLLFSKEHIFPKLDYLFQQKHDNEFLEEYATKMDGLWTR